MVMHSKKLIRSREEASVRNEIKSGNEFKQFGITFEWRFSIQCPAVVVILLCFVIMYFMCF